VVRKNKMTTTWKVSYKNRFGKKTSYTAVYGDLMTKELIEREFIGDSNVRGLKVEQVKN
jgi:hypothetical protein